MENKNKSIFSNEKLYNMNYQNNIKCNCCNCVTSFCYCYCQCECHKRKLKDINNIDSEKDLPNLNINELKIKALKDFSYNSIQNENLNNNFYPNLKNLNSSKSTYNIDGIRMDNNRKNLISMKRMENNFEKMKISNLNKSEEINYVISQKTLKPSLNPMNKLNENNNSNFLDNKENHYKTQTNFNLKKYYQLNNNMNNKNKNPNYNTNTLKSQIEFNKLLNSIKGNDNTFSSEVKNINNNNANNHKKYETFSDRENKCYNKINGFNLDTIRNSYISSNSNNSCNNSYQEKSVYNNGSRNTVNFNRNDKLLELYNDQNNSNMNAFCSNTEYNKPFISLNLDNGNNINLEDRNVNINNNISIQIPSNNFINNNLTSRNSIDENSNNSKVNLNGGKSSKELINNSKKLSQNIKNVKLNDDFISYNNNNNSTLNKSNKSLLDNIISNDKNKLNNTEPRYSNSYKNTEIDNVNIKFNYLETNNSKSENKNDLIESKDINGDSNNFIVTFGAKGNSEIKNIIASVKNELNLNNINSNVDNGKRNENINTDQNINNIIIDYENLKKRYAPNKLFTGLQNNIKDLNENININNNHAISDNCSNKSIVHSVKNNIIYSKSNFSFNIKGQPNYKIIEENEKYKNEINNLNIELKESKTKIEELMKLLNNYQKEIYSLKGQLTKTKRDSINESKLTNTSNNISISNNNTNSNKTKIGKDAFIIKIPENLIRNNNINKDRKSRNNSLCHTNNNNINTNTNYTLNTNRNLQDKYINLNSNNCNNVSNLTSNVSNTNSNCFTNNNNISYSYMTNNNNISCINMNNNNKEVYVKKITTTMKKKIKKSASQKLRINKIYNNLSLNLINKDMINNYNCQNVDLIHNASKKVIYTLFTSEKKKTLLSFDIVKRQFNLINYKDLDNFELNYNESYIIKENNLLNNDSIFLINNSKNNNFYIVTGKNTDLLYMFNSKNKTMNKICQFENNHSKGCLIYYNNNIFCLSGNHNKKVEIFSESNNSLINIDEMNIERCNFSACIIQNKYIFALFGYNYPTQQYLDTIEFYELDNLEQNLNNYNNKCGWKYLNYKNNKLSNLNIEGHLCFNYHDEKIIFFGGFNGKNNEAVDSFYQLVLNGDNFNIGQSNRGVYVEKINTKLNDIYKNGCYFFGNNNGLMLEDNLFTSFDNNSHVHILDIDKMIYNIYSFEFK